MAFRKHTLLPLDDCRKLHLFVAIDRTSKFAFAELNEKQREPDKNQKSRLFRLGMVASPPKKFREAIDDWEIMGWRSG